MILVKIPKLNPIEFHRVGESSECAFVPSFEQSRPYIQKFVQGADLVSFQVQVKESMTNAIGFYLQHLDGSTIPITSGAIVGTLDGFDIWNMSFNEYASAPPAGIYFVRIGITIDTGSGLVDKHYISEPIEIVDELPDSVLIEYSHAGNNWDMAFYPDGKELKLSYQFRIEGGYASQGFTPASKDAFFVDQDRGVILLDSVPYNVYKYTFGPGGGIPNWMADKLNRILSLSEIKINGISHVKNEGAKMEPSREQGYSLSGWSIELVKVEREDSIDEEIEEPAPEPTPISVEYGYLYPLFTFLLEKKATSSDNWRVPTRTEWENIATTAGGMSEAGGKLKSTRTSPTADPKWNTPNTGATDLYNLSFLPGGFRSDDGSGAYSGKNTMGIFWTSQVYDLPTLIYHMAALFNNSAALVLDVLGAYSGLSVRLLRDATTEELLLDDGTACDDYVSNDNHLYPTVKIGSYVILAVNLAETKYRDGSDIPLIEDEIAWGDISVQSTGARCAFGNDLSNVLIEA